MQKNQQITAKNFGVHNSEVMESFETELVIDAITLLTFDVTLTFI